MTNCCERLIAEHRATEALLERLRRSLPKGSNWHENQVIEAQSLYQQLAGALKAHFVLEEQGLFALLNQYRSMILMEVEHDDLLALQQAFAEALDTAVTAPAMTPELLASFVAWDERLRAHIVEEDRGIFPLAETTLLPEEKQMVLRRFDELDAGFEASPPMLIRPEPAYEIARTDIFEAPDRPIRFQALYEREQALIQHIALRAGETLARHWVAQHQCIVVVSGQVEFRTDSDTHVLDAGQRLNIDSRLYFSLSAVTDVSLLCLKIWPHPYYTKGGILAAGSILEINHPERMPECETWAMIKIQDNGEKE